MKNKVILIVLILFLVIAINNYCNATDYTNLQVDLSVIDSNFGIVDCSTFILEHTGLTSEQIESLSSCLICQYNQGSIFRRIYLTDGKFYLDNNIINSTGSICFAIGVTTGGELYGKTGIFTNISDFGIDITSSSNLPIVSNAIYQDSSLSNIYTASQVDSNNVSFFSGAFNKIYGLQNFINDFITFINIDTLFTIFGYSISLIVVAVLFVFGFYLLKKLLIRIK